MNRFEDLEVGISFKWNGGEWKKVARHHAESSDGVREFVPANDFVVVDPQQASEVNNVESQPESRQGEAGGEDSPATPASEDA